MNLRIPLLVPLVVAAVACGRQDSAPFVAPDPVAAAKNTAVLRIVVLRDTAVSRTMPKFVPAGATTANNQTRVNLYRANDPDSLLVRTGLTNAAGEVVFTDVEPGDYLMRPAVRSKSTANTPPVGIPITLDKGDTVTLDTVRIRLSTRVAGLMATEFLTQSAFQRIRHPGIIVSVLRETGTGTGVYILEGSDTTDATGGYEYFTTPGPERVRVTFNSSDIPVTNFKDSTTFQGLAAPYTKKVETVTVTGITPGRDITQNLLFNYPTRITGLIYRDRNASGFRDSTLVTAPATGRKEGLIAGDTIRVQLRDSTGIKVITSALIGTGNTTSQVPTTSATNFGSTVPSYTFSSVAPGKYILTMDKITSRFTSNPLEFKTGPTYTVVVTYPTTGTTTVTQPFALVSGQ